MKWLDLIDYCSYRVSRFYIDNDFGMRHSKKRGRAEKSFFYDGKHGGLIVWEVICVYFMALVLCPLSYLLKVNLVFSVVLKDIPLAVFYIIISFFIGLFYTSKEKFAILNKQCRNEPHKTLKGWLVFLFCIGAIILFVLSVWLFLIPLA